MAVSCDMSIPLSPTRPLTPPKTTPEPFENPSNACQKCPEEPQGHQKFDASPIQANKETKNSHMAVSHRFGHGGLEGITKNTWG